MQNGALSVMRIGITAVVGATLCIAPTIRAQQPGAPSRDSLAIAAAAAYAKSPVDSAAVARAAAVSDTGRMTPGYRDLSRYDTPGYCVAAAGGMVNALWRRNERGTIVLASSRDTVPTAALTIARKCLAQLPDIAHTAPAELPNLLRLALVTRDHSIFDAVIERQLSLATTVQERGYVFSDAIDEVATFGGDAYAVYPMDLPTANALVVRLDALGPEARIPRLLAHAKLRSMAQSAQFDTTALIRESNAMRALLSAFTPAERIEYQNEFSMGVIDSLIVAWYRREPNLPVRARNFVQNGIMALGIRGELQANMEPMLQWLTMLASQVGKPAPAIAAKYWFPASQAAAAHPAPGKVTLAMKVQKGEGLMDSQMAMLRRLHDKYAARGLDILLILKTEGYSWSSPPQSSADEAKTDAWYYLEHLQLPFTVAVDETPFTKEDDGRLVPGRIGFEQQYILPQVLIGRDGRIYTIWLGLESESQLDAFIQQALAAPPSSPQG